MPRTEGNLFGFSEKVVRVAVEHHFAQRCDGHNFFGNEFGRIKDIEIEGVFVLFLHHLNTEFPFRIVPALDRLPQITAMVVGVLSRKLLRLVPHQ
ncbi:hypothetical protein D9M68_981220 [compost metagenome]